MTRQSVSTAAQTALAFGLRSSVSSLTLLAASAALSPALAQTVINDGDNVTVTSAANGETISAAPGVTSTVDGGPVVIVANDGVAIDNAGTLATLGLTQTVQVNENTTGTIIGNAATGTLAADSRVIDLRGDNVTLNNLGTIIGTGDQRNGTVYSDAAATGITINNSGTIDAGAGNLGAGFSAEASDTGTLVAIDNSGTIQGRGNAGAGLATAGDGLRFERTRVDGMLDGTTTGLVTGTISNSGTIASEGANGTVAGIRFVNGVSFQGTLTNSGTISGVQNGVYFGNPVPAGGSDHTGGVVNNLAGGIISSGSRAFNLDGIGLEVNNAGSILGTGNQRNGTFYADSTAQNYTVNNLATGIIDAGAGNEGSGFGQEIDAEGNTFTLVNDGLIQGRGNAAAGTDAAGDGLRIGNVGNIGVANATITNTGTIASEGANGTVAGVRFVNGISFQGTFDNSGTISGVQNGVYFGNPVDGQGADHTGGVFSNLAGGLISSGSRAFNIDGTGLEINNAGSIIGTGDQRNGTVYADSTAEGFTLNNLATGIIDAGNGNHGAGFAAELAAEGNAFTINNDGLIQGRSVAGTPLAPTSPLAADGLRLEGTRGTDTEGNVTFAPGLFTGTINNNSGGLIASGDNVAGSTAGVHFVNGVSFQGTLDNAGTISGAANGLYFGNPVAGGGGDHTGGTVNNLAGGVISSGSRAVNIDGIGIAINNDGTILGTGNQRNGTVYADSTAEDFNLNNLATGIIDAGAGFEGAAFSVELAAAGNAFAIVNDGLIQGRGNAGAGLATAGDGIRLERERVAGMLDGTTTGLFTGTITNAGTIASEGANGTVAGFRAVNGVSFQGVFDNSGTISGVQNGIYFGNPVPAGGGDHTGGVFNNLAGGVISSGSRAFNIDGTGLEINNSGTILATGTQRNGTVYADSTAEGFTLNNLATGIIDAGSGLEGAAFSVELADTGNDFAISNAGAFIGRGQAGAGAAQAGDGLRFERTRIDGALDGTTTGLFTGTIENSGTISSESAQGTTAGIRFVNGVSFQGVITNSGTISGVQNGLYFGNAVPAGGAVNSGVVNNLAGGVISSGSRAVNIDGTGLVLNNAGSILGTGNQRNGTVYADATANEFAVNNLAAGVIDAGAGNAGSGISLQLGAADGDTRTVSVTNDGTVTGRGSEDALTTGAPAGLRLFSNVAGVTVVGDISNSGSISAETAPAILIENVNYTGTITNSGDLTGPAAFDASAALGAVSFVNSGGSLNGDFVGSSFADTLAFQGVSTLAGNILGGVAVTTDAASTTTILGARTLEGSLVSNGALNFVLGSDSLAVAGDTAFGAGSIVNVATPGDITVLPLGQAISVISETGTFTDNGLTVNVIDNDFLVDFQVTLGSVIVTPTAADLSVISGDANVAAFGGALTSAFAAGGLDAGVANALNGIAAGDVTGFETATLQLLPAINEGVTREVFETHGLVDQFVERRLSSDRPRGAWVQGFGRTADRDAESVSVSGYDATSFGVAIGADAALGETVTIGAAFNYASIDIDSDGPGAEETELDSFEISAYAGYRSGPAFVSGQAGYVFGDGTSSRAGLTGPVSGSFDVDGFTAQAQAGYDIENGPFTITPQAGLRFASLSQDDFTETGGLNLTVDAASVQYLDLRAGADLAADFGTGFQPFARAAYVYDVIGDERVLAASFDGAAAPFALSAGEPAQSRFEIGTGFAFDLAERVAISVEYDGEFASGYQAHGGFVRARLAF